jgi:hypothetical protein
VQNVVPKSVFDFFDESRYLVLHPDVARAVENGEFKSAFHHFCDFGFEEGRSLKSRNDPSHGRIVIARTGRAGTTLLVQIFTALCFDTGYDLSEAISDVDRISHAGLEHKLDEHSSLVVKWPWLAEYFKDRAIPADLRVSFIILPMRDLAEAAESRRRVHRAALSQGKNVEEYPGGLWLTKNPDDQETILSKQFYETVRLSLRSNLNPIIIDFPRFARDPEYLWDALLPVWAVYGVTQSDLSTATAAVLNANKISSNRC